MKRFPLTRKRRLRYTQSVRSLVSENVLTASDFIWPVFVLEGENRSEEISSMPGVFRMSQDLLLIKLNHLFSLELKAVALFPVVTDNKTEFAEKSYNPDGLVQCTIRAIKAELPADTKIPSKAKKSKKKSGVRKALPKEFERIEKVHDLKDEQKDLSK